MGSTAMTSRLSNEETMLVDTVRTFIDRDVKPTVREVEHANEYPEAWIEQMKSIGIFALAVPEEYGGSPVSMPCYVEVTEGLARGWMSLAGAMGGHTVVAKLISLYGNEEQRQKYLPRMASGEMRATMALTEPGPSGDDDHRTRRRQRAGDQRREDLDHQRSPVRPDRTAVQDRSTSRAAPYGHFDRPGRTRSGSHRLARPAQAGLQGRRELRAVVRRLPRTGLGDPRLTNRAEDSRR